MTFRSNTRTKSQQAATRNKGKAIVNSPPPIYDQEPDMVTEYDALSKEKEIDKLVALISLSFKKIYKPTNNNIKTSSNTIRANQDNSPRINRGTGYDNQRAINVVGTRENVGTQVVWKSGIQCYNCKEYEHVARECQKSKWDDIDDEPEDQELEAHYMYMAKIQEVSLDVVDNSRPVFDTEPLQKVQNHDDNYNVFANDRQHPEQPKSVNDTYPDEQGDNNIILDSLDMSTNGDQADHDDDLARERNLLASLIEKLKCEADDSKNRCYNDNLALMLAPETDEMIHLAQEIRSKL
ncbi:retrovirus-related pol polyprotein from transposon TNT 1-94, partial [Tanacetum coccineum]